MWERIDQFFSEDLWNFPLSQEKGWRRFRFKWLRIFYLAGRGFFQDRCSLSASSLTYYTLMSIVPVLAMAFAVAGGFGYHDLFRKSVLDSFREQSAALTEIFAYADKFLDQAKGGIVAGIGFVVLFWTVALLLSSLETILNEIWGVKTLRSWRRILSDYFALMLIGPFLFILASSATVFIVGELQLLIRSSPQIPFASSALLFLASMIPYCLFWFLFSFVYIFMPNAKVKFVSALWGGIVGGTLYLIVQWGYIHFQVGVSRYGAVYGSMAALPLFLVWVQLSWFIFLLGAEVSFAHQTLEEHEFEARAGRISHNFKQLMCLWIVRISAARFEKGEAPVTKEYLVKRHQIPFALAGMILDELLACGLLLETKSGFIPSRSIETLRIADVLQALDAKGESSFPFIDSKALSQFEKALEQFRKQIENSPENKLIKHVSDSL